MKENAKVIVNIASGYVNEFGQDVVRKQIMDIFGPETNLIFVEPEKLSDELEALDGDTDTVFVGGGDGTIKSAAQILGSKQIPFGIIPLGTMNLMAQDLGIPPNTTNALKEYQSGAHTRAIDVGVVNGEQFLCNAALGAIPKTAKFRERSRKNGILQTIPLILNKIFKELDHAKSRTYTLSTNGENHDVKTPLLVISNNLIKQTDGLNLNTFQRECLTENTLGVYSSEPKNAYDKIRFLMQLGIGGWSKDPIVRRWTYPEITISTDKKTCLISLDGENTEIETPLKFKTEHKALNLIVPKKTKSMRGIL